MLGTIIESGESFELPANYVTETAAILAKRRTGKSNTAVAMAEELWDRGHPWVAIDGKGDWYGVRSDGDEPGSGLPIPVFGGLHGDLPLHEDAGAVMAHLVYDRRLTCVLDVSRFPSKAAQARFLAEFARTIYELHQAGRRPLHLFLEEAHKYIPQTLTKEDGGMAACVGAWSDLVNLGGAFGLGCTLITQRAAALAKSVLNAIEILITHRIRAELDRKQVAGWFDDGEEKAMVLGSLRTLEDGEAWITNDDGAQRVMMRRRRTFDSGATPTMDDEGPVVERVELAEADLAGLRNLLASEIEQAEANDPAALRAQIADLKAQLAAGAPAAAEEVVVEVVPKATHSALASGMVMAGDARDIGGEVIAAAETLTALAGRLAGHGDRLEDAMRAGMAGVEMGDEAPRAAARQVARPTAAPKPATRASAGRPSAVARDASRGADEGLGKAEQSILQALAWFPAGRTKEQIGQLTGYPPKGSSIKNALASLRSKGYATEGLPVLPTPAGIRAVGDIPPAPTGPDLVRWWCGDPDNDDAGARLGFAPRTILRLMVDAHPATLDKAALAEATGYPEGGSSIKNALAALRTAGLINGFVVADRLL